MDGLADSSKANVIEPIIVGANFARLSLSGVTGPVWLKRDSGRVLVAEGLNSKHGHGQPELAQSIRRHVDVFLSVPTVSQLPEFLEARVAMGDV